MKKLFSLAVSLLMAALFCFFTAALAQEPAATPSSAGTAKKEPAKPVPDKPGAQYKRVWVIQGGNLALIAEWCGHTQADWRSLYDVNPNLPKPEKIGDIWRVWIHPGQTLNLPTGWNYGTLDPEYVVPFPPAPAPPKTTPITGIGASDTGSNRSLWFLDLAIWALILAILVAITFVALLIYGGASWIRRRDPRRYPSVIPGGLSSVPETAVAQIAAAYPGRRYERIERCRLVRDGGVYRILVRRMAFGDGISRDVYLNPRDEVYRGTLPGGSCDYFLRSCGNLGPEFVLPAGWRVVVIMQAQDVDRPAPTPTLPVSPVPPTPPVPPVPPAPVFPAEPESVPVPAPELAPAPEPEPTTATAPAESSALEPALEPEPSVAVTDSEETKSPRKVKVTVGDLSIEVVGNGEVPATKIELEDGVIVILQQQ